MLPLFIFLKYCKPQIFNEPLHNYFQDLSHDFSLLSAAGTPPYTNFVAGFCGTLDYIYADASKLELKREIPLSDHEDVVKEIALPNRIFPSDHMPLVVELKWKS